MSVNSKMTAIANAIRAKTSGNSPLSLDDMPTAIASIQTGSNASDTIKFTASAGTVVTVTTVTGPAVSVASSVLSVSSPEIVTEE